MSVAAVDSSLPPPAAAGHRPIAGAVTPFLVAAGGFSALGLSAGLGSGELEVALRAATNGVTVLGATIALTAPALLAAHEYLQSTATPEVVFRALIDGFITTGRAAWGLCPALLLFSATTTGWAVAYLVAGALLGALGLAYTLRRLHAAQGGAWSLAGTPLLAVWALLTTTVALRLAWDAAVFTLGHA